MSRYFIAIQNVFFLCSSTDIMNNQWFAFKLSIRNNANMHQTFAQIPSHNIARTIILAIDLIALSLKISGNIGYSAMVDIAIGSI